MTVKQLKMWPWLVERIVFAMDQGGLTKEDCVDAVTEARDKLDAINLEREAYK